MSRPGAQDRLARLLAVVPWVAARDGPSIAEVCQRFGVTEQDLLDDLDLLFLCGVYPFTPDALIEVDVADGRVWIRFADYFRRPLRLTPPEGLALLGAGSALLAVPGAPSADDGALARALDKLAAVVGVDGDDSMAVELGPAAPEVLDLVRQATSEHRQVEIDYYSFGRDSSGTRPVEPWQVFNARGQWYLSGFCRDAGGERLFRVDRISAARILAATFVPPESLPAHTTFHADAGGQTIVLDLAPRARWIAEQYPNLGVVEQPDGRLRVTLPVSERPWLERLLLRAGPEVTVVAGDATVGLAAAARVLARYRVGRASQ
jgi:proteasome accessory factor C